MNQVRIAVAGAGMIGKRHIEEIDASDSAVLASIVDPGPAGPELAEKYGVSLYPSLAELFAKDKPDGIILATPNQMHVDGGLECVAAGVPVVVEKPIGDNVTSASRLVEAGERPGYRCSPVTTATTARSWPRRGRSSKAASWERLSASPALPCSTSPTTISTSGVGGDASPGVGPSCST